MTPRDPDRDDDPDTGLDAHLREWGQRPPRTPAATAARRIVSRVMAGRPAAHKEPRRLILAAGTVAALLLAAWWGFGPRGDAPVDRGPHTPPTMEVDVARLASPGDLPPPLPENVVQFWLDPETPVYFVTGPAQPGERGLP